MSYSALSKTYSLISSGDGFTGTMVPFMTDATLGKAVTNDAFFEQRLPDLKKEALSLQSETLSLGDINSD